MNLDATRVNVFIGEPNTGKTNVLEALSLLSENLFQNENFPKLIRFRNLGDLFFDNDVTKSIKIDVNDFAFEIKISSDASHVSGLEGLYKTGARNESQRFDIGTDGKTYNLNTRLQASGIRRYSFEKIDQFQPLVLGYLNPPFGDNLPQILHTRPDLRKHVSSILRERGFKLLLKPVESEIHLAKEVNEELFSYPFQSVSETWKRIIFLLAVLETNENQTLLLDEPEANIFPFFNTQIAETIGLYNKNQFFITTHNPYLLQSLIEKTPKRNSAFL
ncbi:MAG: AAA family ATPase [Lewinellaceae bacterium]|nr:AAA family ATPase [Lewinellaceae bacterium]